MNFRKRELLASWIIAVKSKASYRVITTLEQRMLDAGITQGEINEAWQAYYKNEDSKKPFCA